MSIVVEQEVYRGQGHLALKPGFRAVNALT